MKKQFSKTELKFLAEILEMAKSEFSNHGCNDFPVDPTEENKQFLIKMIKATSDEEDASYKIEKLNKPSKTFFDKKECYFTYDWVLMLYFANRCKEIIGETNEE